ncbi:MAG: glycosyltransferase, partial [Gammaproteobacteria bacterium]|nr:glycosyltransferase [Gammaproteobacteria bacterium]
WSVRHSLQSFQTEKWSLRQIIRAGGYGLWHPDAVTFNAFSGRNSHLRFGYGRYSTQVIVNGVDLERFQRNVGQRQTFRHQLDVADDVLLVGYVGRLHALKDLPTLIGCFSAIHRRLPQARFVLVGHGLIKGNPVLDGLLAKANLGDLVECLGPRDDVTEVYSGLDLLVLSSLAEGTANVLLEAMACEVPCVTTDTGDCARLVGEARFVAPISDSAKLADRAIAVLELDPHTRDELGVMLRCRMRDHYDQGAAVAAYMRLYDGLIERKVGG